jgi:tetratricopeptide (TPR) repeat protein
MKRCFLTAVLFIFCLTSNVLGQQSMLEGYVYKVGNVPVPYVKVKAPPGKAATTDSAGHFLIHFPSFFGPGRPIQIEVEMEGWVIFSPMMGYYLSQDSGSNRQPLPITLVPLKSKLALSAERLNDLIGQLSDENVKRERQNANLKIQLKNKERDLALLRNYAEYYGFTWDEFLSDARRWARSPRSKTKLEQARKNYFLKKYDQAARLSRESGEIALENLEQAKKVQERLGKRIDEFSQQTIDSFKFEGNSFFAQNKFREALAVYNRVDNLFLTGTISKDLFKKDWGELKMLLGNTKAALSIRVLDEERETLLSEAIKEYQQAFTVFTPKEMPLEWAKTKSNLGTSLSNYAERVSGEGGLQLLNEAVEAFEQSLTVFTSERTQEEWATTQYNLGTSLSIYGERLDGERRRQLLNKAVEAFERALTVRTFEAAPLEWANIQNNLGIVLFSQTDGLDDERSMQLLDRSVQAYKGALKVNTRATMPVEWATTQSNLGNALASQGVLLDGERGIQLLNKAIKLHELALTILTPKKTPREWATTQNNLSSALAHQGERLTGERGIQQLNKGIKAAEMALTVSSSVMTPADWAKTHSNLGNALLLLGERVSGERGIQLLEKAVEAYEQALTIRTRKAMPEQWADIQFKLGNAFSSQVKRLSGEKQVQLLEKAVEAYEQALTIFRPEAKPEQWARIQFNLGTMLGLQWERTSGEKNTQLLDRAIHAYESGLKVLTPEKWPDEWARIQFNLGTALAAKGKYLGGEERTQLLEKAVEAYAQALKVNTREARPEKWAETQGNLARVFVLQENWPSAAKAFANVLIVNPQDETAYQLAAYINQEILFNYTEAFRLNQQWQENNQDPLSTQADFAVRHFTTARFIDCEKRITKLLAHGDKDAVTEIVLRVVEIANLVALGKANLVLGKIDLLIATVTNQTEDFHVESLFDGIRNFVRQYEGFSFNRNWLEHLFDAIENKDRKTILKELQMIRAKFKE